MNAIQSNSPSPERSHNFLNCHPQLKTGATTALRAGAELPVCLYKFMNCTFCSLPDPWPIVHYKFIFPSSQKGIIKPGEVTTFIYSCIKNQLKYFYLGCLPMFLFIPVSVLAYLILILCWDTTPAKQKTFTHKGFFIFAQIEVLQQDK